MKKPRKSNREKFHFSKNKLRLFLKKNKHKNQKDLYKTSNKLNPTNGSSSALQKAGQNQRIKMSTLYQAMDVKINCIYQQKLSL